MKKINVYYTALLVLSLISFSCSDDDSSPADGGEGNVAEDNYVIAATPDATEGVADYLLTSESVTEGEISISGNGIEQDGSFRYYITNNNKFFSLLYGGGNPGAVTTYQLDDTGELDQLSDFQAETVHTFTSVNDDVLMTQVSRSADDPSAYWFILDTETSQFTADGQINTADLAPEGEQAYFSWMTQVGDKVFAPFFSIKACCNDTFGTDYPDQAWVAVYSYPEMELETVIQDDRTSFIGRYFTNGLSVDERGDAYAFSSSVAATNGTISSTKPSAVTRINNGETEFDPNYFFNLEEASGGYNVTNHIDAGNGDFVVFMDDEKGPYDEGRRLAVINVYDKTFEWIEGMPDPNDIPRNNVTGRNSFVDSDGTVHVGVTTTESSYIYNIDVETATATQGLEVDGGTITAISKLSPASQE